MLRTQTAENCFAQTGINRKLLKLALTVGQWQLQAGLPLLGFPTQIWGFHGHAGLWVLIFKFGRNLGFKKFWDRNLQNAYTNNNTLSLCRQIEGCDIHSSLEGWCAPIILVRYALCCITRIEQVRQ